MDNGIHGRYGKGSVRGLDESSTLTGDGALREERERPLGVRGTYTGASTGSTTRHDPYGRGRRRWNPQGASRLQSLPTTSVGPLLKRRQGTARTRVRRWSTVTGGSETASRGRSRRASASEDWRRTRTTNRSSFHSPDLTLSTATYHPRDLVGLRVTSERVTIPRRPGLDGSE